jgi:hypothetical protein
LLGKVGSIRRSVKADVQFGKSNLNAQLGKAANGVNVLVESRGRLGNEMGLETNTVDSDPVLLEETDNALGTLGLGAGRLKVVVIVVQLGLGVGLGSGLEGQGEVFLAENLVEDGLAVGAVLVEGLVHDVPGVALALPGIDHMGDVGDDDLADLVLGPVLFGFNPRGKLGVPDKSVASEVHAGLAGLGGDDVALGEVEDASFGFGEEPLLSLSVSILVGGRRTFDRMLLTF